jgi:DNA-binding NarL/FixJ family response regulator
VPHSGTTYAKGQEEVVKIGIADDHPIVRAGLKGIVGSENSFAVVAEARDATSTIDMLRRTQLDVLLLDLSMPGRGGLWLLSRALDEQPTLRIVVISSYDPASHRERSLALGAAAYLHKDTEPDDVLAAIREVLRKPVPQRVRRAESDPHTGLSNRQYDIFMHLVSGKSVTDIATMFNLSVKTVSTHKVAVQKRLSASGVVDLVRYATEHGLTTESP